MNNLVDATFLLERIEYKKKIRVHQIGNRLHHVPKGILKERKGNQ